MRRRSRLRLLARTARLLGAFTVSLTMLPARDAAAQQLAGDYVLSVDGQAIMSLALHEDATGRLTGTVSAAGKSLPLSGVARGAGGVFISSAPDGSRLHWEIAPQGSGLAVVMSPMGIDGRPDPALAQRHVMLRGQPGSGGIRQGSQKWIARLSAAADSIVSWCASPMYAESDLCVNAMQVLRKVAPALMIARFATSGQATSLMRVLAQGPGSAPAELPQLSATDDSFLGAVDPAIVEDEPPPDELEAPPADYAPPEPSPPTSTVPTLAQTLLGGGRAGEAAPPPSEALGGDWVMLHAGSEMLRLSVEESDGKLTGTLSLMGSPFPISGSARGGEVEFTTRSAGGQTGRWQGIVAGDRLSLTLTTSSGSETYELTRQGVGWSDATPLARRWDALLRGNTIGHSAGARDPSTGAPTETLLHFCDDGRLRLEIAGSPGAEQPAWRVVAKGDQAALELSSAAGTIQVGLARPGGDPLTFAGQPARLLGTTAVCR